MEAKIYNLDEYRAKKTAAIKKERGKNMANHPSRKVDKQSFLNRTTDKLGETLFGTEYTDGVSFDRDPTPPHGIERPVQYDQEKDLTPPNGIERPNQYNQDKD